MILKILGIIDILTAIFFWTFGILGIVPKSIILIFAFYLLIKGVVFLISADIASILDIVCASIIFISLNFVIPTFLVIIVAIFLLQKGIFSLLS